MQHVQKRITRMKKILLSLTLCVLGTVPTWAATVLASLTINGGFVPNPDVSRYVLSVYQDGRVIEVHGLTHPKTRLVAELSPQVLFRFLEGVSQGTTDQGLVRAPGSPENPVMADAPTYTYALRIKGRMITVREENNGLIKVRDGENMTTDAQGIRLLKLVGELAGHGIYADH